ncbi:MAG TPA: hypothetical protein VIJ39_05795 [Solirubrobacteraceae bacterium]
MLVLAFALSSGSALASTTHDFISSFESGPSPEGIAVDQSTGDLYVILPDQNGGSLVKYDSTGKPLGFAGLPGEPSAIENLQLGLSGESEVAVDNSTGPDKGDIYIAAGGRNGEKIDIFSPGGNALGTLSEQISVPWGETCGVAVDTAGSVYIGIYGGYIDKFEPKGGTVTNSDFASALAGANEPCNIAADSQGDVFASKWENGPVFRYEASQFGSLSATSLLVAEKDKSVAVDPITDHVYVEESNQISEYGARGEPLAKPIGVFANVGEGAIQEGFGIAVNGVTGDIYVVGGQGIDIFGPAVTTPTAVTGVPSSVETKSATLGGTVNPEGLPVTSCEFEYGLTSSYGKSVPCATTLGTGGNPIQVTAAIAALQSETEYHFRLIASNANGESVGSDQTFRTPAPVATGEVTDLGTTGATLNGKINPEGLAVISCEFKYGITVAYGHTTPCASNPGSGKAGVDISAAVAGLTAHTTYHFELVATNSAGEQVGGDSTFTTGSLPAVTDEGATDVAGSSATLVADIDPTSWDTTYHFEFGPTTSYGDQAPIPDTDIGAAEEEQPVALHIQGLASVTTYHYRVVASDTFGVTYGPDKTFVTQTTGGELTLLDGRRWELVSPSNKHGAGLTAMPAGGGVIEASEDGEAITYLASAPIDETTAGNRAPEWLQAMASRHGDGWSNQMIATPHDESYPLFIGHGSEYDIFSPDLSSAILEPRGETPLSPETTDVTPYLRSEQACEEGPEHCYVPLVTAGNVPPGTKFGIGQRLGGHDSEVEPVDASPDLKHVILTADVPLTSDNAKGALYEWTAGRITLVSVLPEAEGGGGVAGIVGYAAGTSADDMRNAVSDDGSRVIWTSTGSQHLYLRDIARGETVQLDGVRPGGTVSSQPVFQTASTDGSRVFFTDVGKLTAGSAEGDLYECEIIEHNGQLECELTDITDQPIEGQVLGAGNDGANIYFMSSLVLAAGAEFGDCTGFGTDAEGCNLYVAQKQGAQWSIRFIARVSGSDVSHISSSALNRLSARVSPNGRFVTFMSNNSLTGYDNRDASTGEPDEEVYLYDSATGDLTCASCNPTGGRPVGIRGVGGEVLSDRPGRWEGSGVAANIPAWTTIGERSAIYQTRYLSDSGRLFFNSADALVPQDTNGLMDVYEYEPEGVGSCTDQLGCVDLTSSGDSNEESAFLDASADGNDVFFLTTSRLSAADVDTAFDIYDAHVCSASVPCVESAVSPPACETSDSCKAGPTPQPASFGAPSSETFSGSGNVVGAETGRASARTVGLTSAQKLARALRSCAKLGKKKARVLCRARAHRRFPSHPSGGASRHPTPSTGGRRGGKTMRVKGGR